jgi:hypothetical protein
LVIQRPFPFELADHFSIAKLILQLMRYSTIFPFSTTALWLPTFTLRMPRTVLLASFTAMAAASYQLVLLLARTSITFRIGIGLGLHL